MLITSCPGAADANERRGAGGEAFLANRPAAYIAYFVYVGIDFPECRVNRRKMIMRLRGERRDVLPLECHRRAFGVMLVVAPGGALARAGDDRGELALKLCQPVQRLLALRGQPLFCGPRVSHLRRLSFKVAIPSAGETNVPARQAL